MQAKTATIHRPAHQPTRSHSVDHPARKKSTAADAEIHAYAAIRDLLLGEAEKTISAENLRRATSANESVEACLLPLRSPYEAQFLSEAEAARERQRCFETRSRIAQLQRKLT